MRLIPLLLTTALSSGIALPAVATTLTPNEHSDGTLRFDEQPRLYQLRQESNAQWYHIVGGLGVGLFAVLSGQQESAREDVKRDLLNGRNLADADMRDIVWIERSKLEKALLTPLARRDAVDAFEARKDVKNNRALVNSGITVRLAMGYTGKGVSVGLADDGAADQIQANLKKVRWAGTFNPSGVNFNIGNEDRHASLMAQVIAGDVGDTNGVRGVAPNVSLHNIHMLSRSSDGILAPAFYTSSAGNPSAIRYIADNNLDIVNGSFVANMGSDAQYRTAAASILNNADFIRALDNGSVFVFATGNEGQASSSSLYARLGGEAGARGQVIAVGGVDHVDMKTPMFNRCGGIALHCLLAPTVFPVINHKGEEMLISGTSTATAVVSGTLALLKEQFPELTGANLAELVLATADDLGDPGPDEVYGRGVLNVGRAFAPQGNLSLLTGTHVSQSQPLASHAISGQGVIADSVKRALSEVHIIAADDYDRGYEVAVSSLVGVEPKATSPIELSSVTFAVHPQLKIALGLENTASLTWSETLRFAYGQAELNEDAGHGALRIGYDPRHFLSSSFNTSLGHNGLFVGMAKGDDHKGHALWTGYRLGSDDPYSATLMGGYAVEEGGFAGLNMQTGNTDTAWFRAGVTYKLSEDSSASVDATMARVEYTGGDLINSMGATLGSARATLSSKFTANSKTSMSIGTPLATLHGNGFIDRASALTPASNHIGGVIRSQDTFKIARKTPIDIGLSHDMDVGDRGLLRVSAAKRLDGSNSNSWVGATFEVAF